MKIECDQEGKIQTGNYGDTLRSKKVLVTVD
jgi:hypothetical protein